MPTLSHSIPFQEDSMVILGGSTPTSLLLPTIASDVPSRQALNELLKHFPIFIDMEPSMTNMNNLFPTTKRIPVEVDSNPKQSFIA